MIRIYHELLYPHPETYYVGLHFPCLQKKKHQYINTYGCNALSDWTALKFETVYPVIFHRKSNVLMKRRFL